MTVPLQGPFAQGHVQCCKLLAFPTRRPWHFQDRKRRRSSSSSGYLAPLRSRSQYAVRLTVCQTSPKPVAYPAGKRQAKVKLPAFVVILTADETAASSQTSERLAAVVASGATAVLLLEGANPGGAELYNAAVQLKEQLRGRATLLIADRPDIADAVEADGVILSAKGLPTLVARRMMQNTAGLIGRSVNSAADAAQAAADGASFVVLEGRGGSSPTPEEASAASSQQKSSGKIPIIGLLEGSSSVQPQIAATADGAAIRLNELQSVAVALGAQSGSSPAEQASFIVKQLSATPSDAPAPPQPQPSTQPAEPVNGKPGSGLGLKQLLASHQNALLEDERQLLTDATALLNEVTPQLEELGLLDDALRQLDELFLLVVVGEFNSGKSTIINALLGSKFLADGILPTTNEISILKFAESGKQEMVQEADGSYVQYVPAPLLEQVNIVDTPGTNVIVDRQQRLTEEFVPRADLVLFCLSADRPFTESEVKFLRYIREWGKKVIFIVNKIDILSSTAEEEEVSRFVADSAARMLGVQASQVLPISARKALQAKIAVAGGQSAGFFAGLWGDRGRRNPQQASLADSNDYKASRFGELEDFIFQFLVGTASGGEGARLKLQTPLFVSEALLSAAQRVLEGELEVAKQEARAAKSVKTQLQSFRADMDKDGAAQRSESRRLVNGAVKRAQKLVDETLLLSNANTLSAYLLGSGSDSRKLPIARAFQNEVVGDSAESLRKLTADHGSWLQGNCDRQVAAYRDFAEERVRQLSGALASTSSPSSNGARQQSSEEPPQDAAARRAWREARARLDEPAEPSHRALQSGPPSAYAPSAAAIAAEADERIAALGDASATSVETAAAAVAKFEPKAAAALLEEEIREAVVGTVGTAVGAGLFGVVLTWVLPTTVEDLLAASLAGLAGYISILNLPLKRAEAKAKLQRAADGFLQDIDSKLERELAAGLDACQEEVMGFMQPVEALTQAQVDKLQHALDRVADLSSRLDGLQMRAANVE